MPALRWAECKSIANYQHIRPPYTHDHILVFLALLAFPTEDDIEEYREMVGNAYLATGLIQTEEDVETWRNGLILSPNWTYDESIHAWVHNWGARTPSNQPRTTQIQEILSLLD